MYKTDVAIIGIGRVGLPLALSLLESGFKVIGVDTNQETVDLVNSQKMPFDETGCEELIKKVNLEATTDISKVEFAQNLIITVGTPLVQHIETDLSQINKVVDNIMPYLRHGHNIILRSTIAPKTTEYIKKKIEQKTCLVAGETLFISFCPERIAEGKALEEIKELPQIIGCEDQKSFDMAKNIFSRLTPNLFRTTYTAAELVKLFNNISRYINFAVANQFAIISENYDENINDIIHMANYKYPRGNIATPGFTAGTCLRKDFGMINESNPYSDILLSAWKINEFMPKFLVDNLKTKTEMYNKNITILGYSFKSDTDDTRDSLIPKLIRYIEREVPKSIKIHDPYLSVIIDNVFENVELDDALEGADILYIGTNHKQFVASKAHILNKISKECWIVDIWDVFKTGKIFFKVGGIEY